ncbi:MAG: transporter substrate-binding domain-containing protein [Chromatiales bacterium]
MRYSLAEKHWLDEHQTLHIGVVEQTAPLLFYGGGSNPQGLVADYLRVLALHLGLQLEVVRFADRAQLIQALRNRDVDVLGAWPVGFNQKGGVLLSRPYLNLPVALYGKSHPPSSGLSSLSGKSFAVLQGSVWEQLPQIVSGLSVTPYSTLKEALEAAAEGRVYAYLGDAASADYMLKRQPIGDLKSMQLDLSHDLALATRSDNPVLLSLLQKGLDRIGPDELQEIWYRWPGVERPQSFAKELSSLWLWLPLLVVWSALMIWGVNRYSLKKEDFRHTRLKQAIRRFQRREKRLKEKLLGLKQKTLKYRGETHQHRQRQRLMNEVMPSAAWVWEPTAPHCQWDEQMYALFRQDPSQFEPTPSAILELVHADDRAQVASLFRQPEANNESRISYRLVLPDKKVRWLLDFSYYSIDQAGGEQRIGLCWDITEFLLSAPSDIAKLSVES